MLKPRWAINKRPLSSKFVISCIGIASTAVFFFFFFFFFYYFIQSFISYLSIVSSKWWTGPPYFYLTKHKIRDKTEGLYYLGHLGHQTIVDPLPNAKKFNLSVLSILDLFCKISFIPHFHRCSTGCSLIISLNFLVSGKGCGLWLWHSLDFSLDFFPQVVITKRGVLSKLSIMVKKTLPEWKTKQHLNINQLLYAFSHLL